ncbi:MAG: pyruvate kinase [Alphaproteobacteria bacterium]|nr:pyruvate kinase [Alphaproteobacteria bacterium]
MKRYRNGKIVATIGPSSNSAEVIEKLYLSGVDVFRLNFSHGDHAGHEKVYDIIRSVGHKYHSFPTILADLQGPKLRVGTFENNKIFLEEGDIFRFDLDKTPGDTKRVNLPHPEILEALEVGTPLLLDDGKLRFEVLSCSPEYAEVKVIIGGQLSNRKGVNVPHVMLPIPALTEKDRKDLDFALKLGVDWVALSFVQNVEDVEEARNIVKGRAKVLSKIEKPLAVQAIEPITQISDGIMVARGDLGVEMNPEEVPAAQRLIINTCHRMGKPVIVATQMLESMITSPSPTRAEVSDVANAVYSGADATMLSAESASGQYPLEAVNMMSKIIEVTEKDPSCVRKIEDDTQCPHQTSLDAKCEASKSAAMYSNASCVVMFSDSFEHVACCARFRPICPILLGTSSEEVARQAGLLCGVYSFVMKKEFNQDKLGKIATTAAIDRKFAKVGDSIVMLNDFDNDSVNILKI